MRGHALSEPTRPGICMRDNVADETRRAVFESGLRVLDVCTETRKT